MKKIGLFLLLFFLFLINVKGLEPNIYSKNAVLYNMNDDMVIMELNKDEKISIASMTKIMTAYVAIKNIDDINKKVVLTKSVFDGLAKANASVAGFKVGQTVTIEDLLYGLMLPSGADAANAIGINIFKGNDNFVSKMNEEAKIIGLKNTHYANITGLDDENHYSSVNDVAMVLKIALKNELFKKIFTTKKYLTSDKSMTLYSTMYAGFNNYKISSDSILGGKTGHTDKAGRCLASISYDKTNNINYLLVTANASNTSKYYHLLDARNIYNYYFSNYKYHTIINKNDYIVSVNTKYAKEDKIDVRSNKTIKKYLNNSFDKNNLKIDYDGLNEVSWNLKKGSKLGNVKVLYNNDELASFNVYLDKSLHFSILKFIKINILYIVCIIVLLVVMTMLITKERNKKDGKRRIRIK